MAVGKAKAWVRVAHKVPCCWLVDDLVFIAMPKKTC